MNIRIAISTRDDNGLSSTVSEHFGRCAYFTLAEIEDNEIKSTQVIANPYAHNHVPGQIPAFIKEQGVNVMLTGGMGRRAVSFFEQFSIDVATGAAGTVHQTIQAYLAGKLRGASPCAESQRHHGHGHDS
jgi:predicted Fe-Mo cluster-binding NifX family protein